MTTDIDKLHALIDGLNKHDWPIFEMRPEWLPRGIGKTMLLIHQLAGEIQVGDHEKIIAKIKKERDLTWLTPMVLGIFNEQGIELLRYRREPLARMYLRYEGREVSLFFFSSFGYEQRVRGFHCLEFNLIDY